MKTNVNFRFGSYVFLMTVIFVGTAFWWQHDSFPPALILPLLVPSAREILGPSYKVWQESDREISDRALVWGFLGFLVAFWVGALYVGFHYNPAQQGPKYILWMVAAVLWTLCIYPVYRWWRVQKREAHA